MPGSSEVQGSKISSLLYSLFTLDILDHDKIMKNPKIYKIVTGKELKIYNIEEHNVSTYVDDTQHIVASKTHEGLKEYIQDMHEVLLKIYKLLLEQTAGPEPR